MGPTELIVILIIVLVLFGGAMLPKLAKNIGQAGKELRAGLGDDDEERDRPTDGDDHRR
ncbi:twin-arginine translocase TatA/TatE family subunit [Actinomarinicola tropica]|uniref:Twin-arginine translocase TatA/TatE family subunit n=1 Tax=Actinomarinicola tropica TaxID=2789776 RepID=A0A5Q2RDQ3_9ACTN|nr:twin-arginine translocase TatA/TatE family subunit [Actinomarinicola tropica]QGG93773.1 twin-arginine translocase TatA/TatE family subunit [Actinomarinicola tropica]